MLPGRNLLRIYEKASQRWTKWSKSELKQSWRNSTKLVRAGNVEIEVTNTETVGSEVTWEEPELALAPVWRPPRPEPDTTPVSQTPT